jgi:hypothetical protein
MTALIELVDKRRFVNVLHAVYAVTNNSSHDRNKITFRRENGFTLHIDFAINTVYFRPEEPAGGAPKRDEDKRLWSVNVGIGDLHELLLMFIRCRDDEIRKLSLWEGTEVDGVCYTTDPPPECLPE